jgi:hypothetical protein
MNPPPKRPYTPPTELPGVLWQRAEMTWQQRAQRLALLLGLPLLALVALVGLLLALRIAPSASGAALDVAQGPSATPNEGLEASSVTFSDQASPTPFPLPDGPSVSYTHLTLPTKA